MLLRIELKPEAWTLDYERGIVHGLDGSRHTPEELAQHPERLAVVYHDGPNFREMILVNETMIAHVSAGAEKKVLLAMSSDIDLLQALAAHLEDTPSDMDVMSLFARTDMFSETFSPNALRLRAKLLDTLRTGAPAAFAKDLATTFAIGPTRTRISPFCKLVRTETHSNRGFRGSFAMPATTTYSALCSDTDRETRARRASGAPARRRRRCRAYPFQPSPSEAFRNGARPIGASWAPRDDGFSEIAEGMRIAAFGRSRQTEDST